MIRCNCCCTVKINAIVPMSAEPLVTTYLEMLSRDQLRPKRADARFQVREKRNLDWRFNRDLYFRVGEQWDRIDKRPWTDEQWKEYAAAADLCTSSDIMMTCSPVIMNCAGIRTAELRSPTSVC